MLSGFIRGVLIVVVALNVGLGCSSNSTSNGRSPGADAGSPGSDSGATAGPTAGWVITDALTIRVNVNCLLTSGQTVDDCTTQQSVSVYDPHTTSNVTDAVVTVSLDGQVPISMIYASGYDAYVYAGPKFPKSYRYDVKRGADHAVVTGTAPADFAITLSPSSPSVGTASMLMWTMNQDPQTNESGIDVNDTNILVMSSYKVPDDSGSYSLPTNAFPQAGQYAVTMYKENLQQLYGPTQLSEEEVLIELQHEIDVTVQ